MTLYQKLRNELENYKGFWNYYGMNYEDVLMNESVARDFIYNYFKTGSKIYALDTWTNTMSEYTQMRNIHTVNVFFIGAFLQRMIDENIAIKSEISSNYPFSYIWYLLSFAHDLGYVYENYSEVYIDLPEKQRYHQSCHREMCGQKFVPRKLWYLRHGIDITYMVPSFGVKSNRGYYSQNVLCKLSGLIEYNNGTIIKGPRYSTQTKNNYFYYRLFEMQTLDHGIVGADEFFSKLIINYIREYRVMASRNNFTENFYEFHNEQGLHFCIEQFKIFAYVADCIASHNIYKAENSEDSKSIYEKYFLDCLVPDKFKSISYEDNPLLFILCVADTIEPSKKFSNYSNVELLNLISINYNVNTNSLYVEVDKELYNSNEGKMYISGIEKLEEWCNISVIVKMCDL